MKTDATTVKKDYVEGMAIIKMPISEYKKLANGYTQEDLRKVMIQLEEPCDSEEINFCFKGKDIYLFQTTGKGIGYDIGVLEKALQLL